MEILFFIASILFFALLGFLLTTIFFDPNRASRLIADAFRKTIDNDIKIDELKEKISKLQRDLDALKNFTYAIRSSNKRKDEAD
jgi:predicted ATP-grasp superfamily ATP-dependent carboligase